MSINVLFFHFISVKLYINVVFYFVAKGVAMDGQFEEEGRRIMELILGETPEDDVLNVSYMYIYIHVI